MEKSCTLTPVVTTKWSDGCARELVGGEGNETWVIALLEGEGISCCDLNVRQYVCSGVRGDGPGASLTGCNDITGTDMIPNRSR